MSPVSITKSFHGYYSYDSAWACIIKASIRTIKKQYKLLIAKAGSTEKLQKLFNY